MLVDFPWDSPARERYSWNEARGWPRMSTQDLDLYFYDRDNGPDAGLNALTAEMEPNA